MPNQEVSSPAGGSATAIGMAFQHRAAAWLAVRILADTKAGPLWDWPNSSTIEFIRCETEQPVDDIMVGTSEGGLAFLQAKRSISLDRVADSPFAKTIAQFVRQTLRPPVHGNKLARPWDRVLDYRRDRLVLVVGPTSSGTVVSTIASLLNKIHSLRQDASVDEVVHSQLEKEALDTTCQHIRSAWQARSGALPSEEQIRELLSIIYIQVLDVEMGGREEREATETLRGTVLLRPDQADAAWATLIEESSRLASQRSGRDRRQLQQILDRAGISIRAPRSYENDIRRLAGYSADTIRALANFASISLPPHDRIRIERPSTSELKAAAELGSLLVTGEPGLGKSGALHDVAIALQEGGHDVFFVAADRLESSSTAGLTLELGLDHPVPDVIQNWHGNGLAFLITDALDAARSEHGMRMLQELIRMTLEQGGRWRVVASIRKFDLRYNPGLRPLFTGQLLNRFQDPEFPGTRVFLVPRLDADEISQVKTQSGPMALLVDAINAGPNVEMRRLITLPFNLRILAELIGQGLALDEITPIKTQLELLDRYWQERVIGTDHMGDAREAVLRLAAMKMVQTRVLRVARADLVLESGAGPILDNLLSSNLMQEHQISSTRSDRNTLTFPHHILFDYAIARLLFRGDSAWLVQQIAEDPELVVAFRPSLALHFRHVWELDPVRRSGFWELVFKLLETQEIPLIGKIIGPTEAVEFFHRIQDIEPLTARVGQEQRETGNNQHGKDAIFHFINALTARRLSPEHLVGPKAQPWCQLAATLSEYIETLAQPLGQLLDLKFFWFLSVLHRAKTAPFRTDLQLEIKELAREMIAQAWPCRRLFKLWFGHQDRLQGLIDQLALTSGLVDGARLDEVRDAAMKLSEADLSVLQDFVPYRFLSPWLRSALVGVSDHARNQLIQLLAERSSKSPRPTPYSFDSVIGRPKRIIVDSKWLTFLQSNHDPLRAFAQLSVARYFETRNPGIPGIINKLDRPRVRKLRKARAFWDTILSNQPLKCIYSGEPIRSDYDLDHFLPWSFVTHDLIWNLTPAPGTINLAKSGAIPNLGRYLSALVDQHYLAMPVLKNALTNVRGARLRALESITLEYASFFKIPLTELFLLSRDRFENVLSTELHAQADVARRLNFVSDWIWADLE